MCRVNSESGRTGIVLAPFIAEEPGIRSWARRGIRTSRASRPVRGSRAGSGVTIITAGVLWIGATLSVIVAGEVGAGRTVIVLAPFWAVHVAAIVGIA